VDLKLEFDSDIPREKKAEIRYELFAGADGAAAGADAGGAAGVDAALEPSLEGLLSELLAAPSELPPLPSLDPDVAGLVLP